MNFIIEELWYNVCDTCHNDGDKFMQRIHDKKLCRELFSQLRLDEIFTSAELDFEIHKYNKGEMINQPSEAQDYLLFIISGEANIYAISEDGRLIPRLGVKEGGSLGTVEFFGGRKPLFYVEALTEVECLALSIKKYKEELSADNKFLHFIISDLTEKIHFVSQIELPTVDTRERLLSYLNNETTNQRFKGMEQMAGKIGCSRRQLQRVVVELCEEEVLEKIGRGEYGIR